MKWLFILILPVCIIACKERSGYISKKENNGDPVFSVETEDKEMNRAIEQAKVSYDQFLTAFAKQDSSMRDFTVKLKFPLEDGGGEHMWVNELFYKGKMLYGVLASEPVNVVSLQYGDTIEVKTGLLSDWMYIKNDKMKGGYTMLVLYNKMSEAEKRSFRDEIDFDLE